MKWALADLKKRFIFLGNSFLSRGNASTEWLYDGSLHTCNFLPESIFVFLLQNFVIKSFY